MSQLTTYGTSNTATMTETWNGGIRSLEENILGGTLERKTYCGDGYDNGKIKQNSIENETLTFQHTKEKEPCLDKKDKNEKKMIPTS